MQAALQVEAILLLLYYYIYNNYVYSHYYRSGWSQ